MSADRRGRGDRNGGARGARGGRRDERADRGDRRPPASERGLGGDQVEGVNAVRELLRAHRRPIREVLIATGRDEREGIEEIIDLAYEGGVRVREVAPAQLAALAKSEAPQGVLARAAAIEAVDPDTLLADPRAFIVALDGVTDPGNLGAVMRTAELAGATGIVIPKHRSARLSPAALKAAAGAAEWLPVAQAAGMPAFLDRARRAGVWSVGLDADGDTEIHDLPVADAPVVLVLGAEGRGLARLTRDRCELVARIDLVGHLDSLNVSAAAAVACFAVARRRAAG
ncbi:MAG: 23S rRNA (guanosine(2251)-2'-O)-methyltransferase RlmB [Actinomycetes bacterium]